MKHLVLATLLSLGLAAAAVAATPVQTYNDVLVVVNSNSSVSQEIGTYFAAQRGIPSANVVSIAVPTTEEITDAQFTDLRTKLESAITTRGLTNTINFIVTTKGMPLKVNRTDATANASVESELALILGPYAANIGRSSRIASPYYNVRADFSHATYGIYLVTRLDGYTSADIHGLIDRAAIIPSAVPAGATFVLDEDPTWNTTAPQLNTNLGLAATALTQRGRTVTLNTTTTYLTNQTNVLGYISFGSDDANAATATTNGQQHNTYLPDAIGETYVSTSARSFTATMTYGQSAVADMIAEGITGVKGYVYEPYATSVANAATLMPMYSDGFALAECFASASSYLSWMDVVVGDPKARMINTRYSSGSTSPLPAPTGTLTASTTSLPSGGGTVTLTWTSLNASSAIIDQGVGSVALSGSTTVSVTATKTFNLTLTNSAGTVATYQVNVTVAVAPPPVNTLVVFSAVSASDGGRGVLVAWSTSSESNLSSFEVQRKKGTGAYAKVGTVAAAGTSTTTQSYSFNDPLTKNGSYMYRLRAIGKDGSTTYSPETSIQLNHGNVTTLTSYPNPFNPSTTISFTLETSGPATLKVYNVIGQEVATLFNGVVTAGEEKAVTFNAGALASGLYFSVLESGGQRFIQKMLLSK